MFHFDDYIEAWAMKYKPMQHHPKNNVRMFRTESIKTATDPAIVQKMLSTASPFVSVVTHVDADFDSGLLYHTYRAFIYVRCLQGLHADDLARTEAKREGLTHAVKLLAYLYEDKYTHENPDLKGTNVETGKIFTAGLVNDGWYATEILLDDMQAYERCVLDSDYV